MFQRPGRFVLVLVALALTLSGCSTNGGPKRYTDDVRSNYTRACTEANTEKLSANDAEAYCGCTYQGLVDKIAFNRFKEFDNDVRDKASDELRSKADLAAQYPEIVAVFESCVAQGPASPTTTVAPTASR